MLQRGCAPSRSSGACRFYGLAVLPLSPSAATRALFHGCAEGDGGSCLAAAELQPQWDMGYLRDRAFTLLWPVCDAGRETDWCPAQARGQQSAACVRLAELSLADGRVDDARDFVSAVLTQCDRPDSLCEASVDGGAAGRCLACTL